MYTFPGCLYLNLQLFTKRLVFFIKPSTYANEYGVLHDDQPHIKFSRCLTLLSRGLILVSRFHALTNCGHALFFY